MADDPKPQVTRASLNRVVGLSCYAGGICLLGVMAFSLYDDGGFKGGITNYVIGLAAALVFFGLGYSTNRRH